MIDRLRIPGSNFDAQSYERYAAELVRFATGLVGPQDAQDVVQTVMVRVLTSRRWHRVENPRAYLYRAVTNQVRSQFRSAMRRRAREARTASRGVTHPPVVRPDVLRAVSKLSIRQRAVIVLTYWDDLPEAAVADRLGISVGSVRQHLSRARAKLRGILDD